MPKHGKAAGEVVEKDADVAEVVAAATLEDIHGKSRCAWVTLTAVWTELGKEAVNNMIVIKYGKLTGLELKFLVLDSSISYL